MVILPMFALSQSAVQTIECVEQCCAVSNILSKLVPVYLATGHICPADIARRI